MQERIKVSVEFQADGEDIPGPIQRFRLVSITRQEARRSDRELWGLTAPAKYVTVAEGLSRRDVESIVTDGINWLTYIEGE